MLKTIILDFDGLIVDTEVVWFHIYQEWLRREKGYDLSMQEFLICVGSSNEDLFRALDEKGIHVDRDAFARDTAARFIEESRNLPAKEGVVDFVRQAKENGLYVTLATSAGRKKPTVHLERLGLLPYFDLLVTAEDVERIKPYPDLFLKVAEKLACTPDECLVVEDSLNGLVAGRNANMRVLIVPNDVTRHSDFQGQYLLAPSLAAVDVPRLIAEF